MFQDEGCFKNVHYKAIEPMHDAKMVSSTRLAVHPAPRASPRSQLYRMRLGIQLQFSRLDSNTPEAHKGLHDQIRPSTKITGSDHGVGMVGGIVCAAAEMEWIIGFAFGVSLASVARFSANADCPSAGSTFASG